MSLGATHGSSSTLTRMSTLTSTVQFGPAITVNTTAFATTLPIVSAQLPVITLTEPIVPVPTNFLRSTTTATPASNNLLVPACKTPYIAEVPDPAGADFVFPQIGCSEWHQDCCPYDFRQVVYLVHCPLGFETQSVGKYTACCPPSYSLLPTGIGRVTPCFSPASVSYVPATTLTDRNKRMVATIVYAVSFPLAKHKDSPAVPIVGGVIGFGILLSIGIVALWIRHRNRHNRVKTQASLDSVRSVAKPPATYFNPFMIHKSPRPPPPPPPLPLDKDVPRSNSASRTDTQQHETIHRLEHGGFYKETTPHRLGPEGDFDGRGAEEDHLVFNDGRDATYHIQMPQADTPPAYGHARPVMELDAERRSQQPPPPLHPAFRPDQKAGPAPEVDHGPPKRSETGISPLSLPGQTARR